MNLGGNQSLDSEQTGIRQLFLDFFDRYEARYSERIDSMMRQSKCRLIIDMHDLLSFGSAAVAGGAPGEEIALGRGVIYQPTKFIPLCELAVHELVMQKQPDYLKVDYRSRPVHVGFEGPVGRVLGPRELYARHLNTLVALEGIITRQSPLRPRLLETVHYCPATNKFSRKEYRDQLTPVLNPNQMPTVNVLPKTDINGNILRTELGLSSFLDSQCAMLQEAPEASPTGQLPRSIELRFDDDLVDSVKAGDRVTVVGTYMPYTSGDSKSFQSIILINHIVHMTSREKQNKLVDADIVDIKQYCATYTEARGPSGVLESLSKAIAPAVYGLTNEKMAVLLMLVGGVERKAHDSHIRGDINILLVGEPSTAKSQLLRFVLGVAPLALNTTGKGSSGVGLTAAVTVDQYSGERSLSAGAMVLADRGILCIDEFDKMSQQDRVSMHEAMEQQTVTITKASIHATLNARCSVLAAANPVYGFYSVRHKLAFNVGLPESLLSRFDLSFIILDQHSSEFNRRIGSHILRNHMTAQPADMDSHVVRTLVERGEVKALEKEKQTATTSSGESVATVEFLRRYIQYAKTFAPTMTLEAEAMVSQHYVTLREEQAQGGKDGFFVTARTLESIIRLSTANAKLRLSDLVEEDDVRIAMSLVRASVHAAKDATLQRAKDKADTQQETASAANAQHSAAEDAGVAAHDDAMGRRTKVHRIETTTPSAGTTAASPSAINGSSSSMTVTPTPPQQQQQQAGRFSTPATVPHQQQPSASAAVSQASSSAAATTVAVDAAHVRQVLLSFQREARDSVELYELQDRLAAMGHQPNLVALQQVVNDMSNNETFITYESTETSDTIYFHS